MTLPYLPYVPYVPYLPYVPYPPYVPYVPYVPYLPYVPHLPYVPYFLFFHTGPNSRYTFHSLTDLSRNRVFELRHHSIRSSCKPVEVMLPGQIYQMWHKQAKTSHL